MRLTRKLAGCDDGTCPAVWDTDDPGLVAIRGATLTDAEALADAGPGASHEQVILVPWSILESYRSTRP
jgi:hypothetical protein